MCARTLATLGLTLLVGACFSEPETADETSNEGTSTGATSPATSGDTGETTAIDPDSTSGDDGGTTGSTGDAATGTTGLDAECEDRPALVAQLEADIVILIDPDVDIPWDALEGGIATANNEGANVAVVLPTEVSNELPDPPCLACDQDACQNNVPLLKLAYDEANAISALNSLNFNCLFDNAPGLPRTSHFWLFTESLLQPVPEGFAEVVQTSGARFHLSTPNGAPPPANSPLGVLVENTFGSQEDFTVPRNVEQQAAFVGNRRFACAWPVANPRDKEFFFVLNNTFIASALDKGEEGVVALPVAGFEDCSNDVDAEFGLAGVPFEFYYDDETFNGDEVAVVCPIACAFLQLEPAEATLLTDLLCEEP